MSVLDNFAFVLVSPKASGNVGPLHARSKTWASPTCVWSPLAITIRSAAAAMAVHADDVLERAHIYPDLIAALDDRTLTVGTTCRGGPYRSETRTLREVAPELIAESDG